MALPSLEQQLMIAVTAGRTDEVRQLIAAGANLHFGGDHPLIAAAWSGKPGVVELLLAEGADVHAQDESPLEDAVLGGHGAVVELLLDAGAEPGRLPTLLDDVKSVEMAIMLIERAAVLTPATTFAALIRETPTEGEAFRNFACAFADLALPRTLFRDCYNDPLKHRAIVLRLVQSDNDLEQLGTLPNGRSRPMV